MSSISDRATAAVRDMREADRPLSEQFRVVAKQWVDAHAAANLLEETKSAVLSRLMLAQGDMPVSRAEMIVKGGTDWADHLEQMVEARKRADLLKVQMKYIEMRHSEWQSGEANQRKEYKMGRQTP